MAEDGQDAEPKPIAEPVPNSESMFTRKGLMVLVVIMCLEAVLLYAMFGVVKDKVNKAEVNDTPPIVQPQFEVGEISAILPPLDVNSTTGSLSFKVWFRTSFPEAEMQANLQARMNDDIRRDFKDQIQDVVLAMHFEGKDFSGQDAKAEMKARIKELLNKELKVIINDKNAVPKIEFDGNPVQGIILEDWAP